jgi:hypothetical protein
MDSKQNEVETVNSGTDVREDASSEEIRQEIRGTRRGMDETLNELGERLHPRHLLDDVVDLFRGGDRASNSQLARTSKDVGRTVSRAVREHPLPALLVGAGIAWWIVDAVSDDDEEGYDGRHGDGDRSYRRRNGDVSERRRRENWGYKPYPGPTAPAAYEPLTEQGTGETGDVGERSVMERTGEKVKGAATAVGQTVSDAASAVGDRVSDAASAVGDTFRQGGRAATSAATASWERGKRSLHDYSEYGTRAVSEQAGRLKDRFNDASDEYPLAMGGVFLAAGMLVGLLLPRSEKEDEWLGETSDEVKDEARRLGEQTIEKAQSVATQTAAAAMEQAEAHGITPENVVDKASQMGSEVLKAGQENLRKEGLAPEGSDDGGCAMAENAAGTPGQPGST